MNNKQLIAGAITAALFVYLVLGLIWVVLLEILIGAAIAVCVGVLFYAIYNIAYLFLGGDST